MPDAEIFGIARLELHQFLPGGFENSGGFFGLGADLFIEALHFTDSIGFQRGGI